MKSSETQQKFIELRASGVSYQKISELLEVSKQTLINWSRELNVDLENHRAIEREYLLSQFLLAKEARIHRLGSILNRLEEELKARDLSELPTDKLLELVLKLSKSIEKEIEPTIFKKTESVVDIDFSMTSSWTG